MSNNHIFYLIDDKTSVTLHSCECTSVVQAALDIHKPEGLAAYLMGKSLTAAVLMASFQNVFETLNVKFIFDEKWAFVSEANCLGQIRGYGPNNLPYAQSEFPGCFHRIDIQSIRASHKTKEPSKSFIDFKGGNLEEAIDYYYLQSAQVPSYCRLVVTFDDNNQLTFAGGVILQKLPGPLLEEFNQYQTRLKEVENFNSTFIKSVDSPSLLLENFLTPLGKPILKEKTQFVCSCSHETFERGLASLPAKDIMNILKEEGSITTTCQYCKSEYNFSREQLESILKVQVESD